jgi:hypothetical protein
MMKQLPDLLDRRPELHQSIYSAFLKVFARREEVASIIVELRDFRQETVGRFEQVDECFQQVDERFQQVDERFQQVDERFQQVDEHFDRLETKMEDGFQLLLRSIDRLGSRWGIRNESVFRQTMMTLLSESFGAQVEQRSIQGEQFDIVIVNGGHILIEIAASVGPSILERLERKRALYQRDSGVAPTRFILATASIHSRRANELREAGFDVVEPEEEES